MRTGPHRHAYLGVEPLEDSLAEERTLLGRWVWGVHSLFHFQFALSASTLQQQMLSFLLHSSDHDGLSLWDHKPNKLVCKLLWSRCSITAVQGNESRKTHPPATNRPSGIGWYVQGGGGGWREDGEEQSVLLRW